MISRRTFLSSAVGLSVATAPASATCLLPTPRTDGPRGIGPVQPGFEEYEQIVAGSDLNVLGVPVCWSIVREGFHPISPERVVILDPESRRRLSWNDTDLKERIQKVLLQRCTWCNRLMPYSREKLDLIVEMMDILTTFYHRPDFLEDWATRLARREALGSTGIGYGFGLLHDFQPGYWPPDGPPEEDVRTMNPPVDWWLFLFPGGVDWDSLDEKPVYFMIGPVLSLRKPGLYLSVMEAISRGVRYVCHHRSDVTKWVNELVFMDRIAAARAMNQLLAQGLKPMGK
jgi:hypothetical protein